MDKLYSIQESTLTDIGDALRSKYGETRIDRIITGNHPGVICKTPNATGFDTFEGGYGISYSRCDVVHIPNATKIKVNMSYQTERTTYDYVAVAEGEYNTATFPTTATKYGDATLDNIQLEFDTDTITFYFKSDSSNDNYLGYYAECFGYEADGSPCKMYEDVEVKNTYSSADVAEAIGSLPNPTSVPEPIVLSGSQSNGCAGQIASGYIKLFGDTITTKDLETTNNMFDKFTGEYIPFDLNFKPSNNQIQSMFIGCKKLKALPKMYNVKPMKMERLFESCEALEEIPDDYFDTWDFNSSYMMNATSAYVGQANGPYQHCHCLRKAPVSWVKGMNPLASYSYSAYYALAYSCYVLDEIVDLPIPYTKAVYTSNMLTNTIDSCHRLKRFTFETNDDGTPIVVQWKTQTLSFNNYTGHVQTGYPERMTNTGITADKEVKDDTTYQALKNDPDYWTLNWDYSRYNHDSAVETINSLPDASAYLATAGGTNTIRFIGNAGKNTDGGAINTMTEEEIAVATAKGWTVSFT